LPNEGIFEQKCRQNDKCESTLCEPKQNITKNGKGIDDGNEENRSVIVGNLLLILNYLVKICGMHGEGG